MSWPPARSTPSFGIGGIISHDFVIERAGDDTAHDLVIQQPDGKIVVVGESSPASLGGKKQIGVESFSLARFNADGTLDATFGVEGRALTDFGGVAESGITGVALQSDGKIVVIGSGFEPLTRHHDFLVARFQADGSLDTSFGNAGYVLTDFDDPSFADTRDAASAVTVLSDGKILVAGTSDQLTTQDDLAVARYNSDGTLDATFSGDGKAVVDVNTLSNQVSAMVVQNDGKIVLAGPAWQGSSTGSDFAITRLDNAGKLDTGFGSGGSVFTDFGGLDDYAHDLAVDPAGKITLAGYSYQLNGGADIALARYNPDGSLDVSFDGDGRIITDLGSANDWAASLALQLDGRIVVAGSSSFSNSSVFAVVRYNPDGSLDVSFDGDGKVTTAFGATEAYGFATAVQHDGRIIVAGGIYRPASLEWDFALARYNADGTLDETFDGASGNGNGLVTTNFQIPVTLRQNAAVTAQQADGKIIVAGTVGEATPKISQNLIGLSRYHADGSLDTSFGQSGRVTTEFISGTAQYCVGHCAAKRRQDRRRGRSPHPVQRAGTWRICHRPVQLGWFAGSDVWRRLRNGDHHTRQHERFRQQRRNPKRWPHRCGRFQLPR